MADNVTTPEDGKSRRKPLKKSTRFYVLKRDGFTCRYCGRKPPEVALVCDHIIPVACGGEDDPDNLITACSDCNGGRSTSPLPLQRQTNPYPMFPKQVFRIYEPELSRADGDYFDATRAFGQITIPGPVAGMCISPGAKFYYGLLVRYAEWDRCAFSPKPGITDTIMCLPCGCGNYFDELVEAGLIVRHQKGDSESPTLFNFVFRLDFV